MMMQTTCLSKQQVYTLHVMQKRIAEYQTPDRQIKTTTLMDTSMKLPYTFYSLCINLVIEADSIYGFPMNTLYELNIPNFRYIYDSAMKVRAMYTLGDFRNIIDETTYALQARLIYMLENPHFHTRINREFLYKYLATYSEVLFQDSVSRERYNRAWAFRKR